MTERVSSDASRNVCRRPEDEQTTEVSKERPPLAPACRDRLVSSAPPDWESLPNRCDENAAMAAQNATIGPPLPPKGAGASTNAARTSERDVKDGAYAAAGRTHDGKSVFVAGAVTKGKMGDGTDLETLSVSVQVGQQSEAQATMMRVGYAGKNVSGSSEHATLNAHYGTENSDGSRGLNIGASATVAAAEITITDSGSSRTIGVSEGIGAESHVGVRDADKDGRPELCVRVGALFFTAGACFESPIVIRP